LLAVLVVLTGAGVILSMWLILWAFEARRDRRESRRATTLELRLELLQEQLTEWREESTGLARDVRDRLDGLPRREDY